MDDQFSNHEQDTMQDNGHAEVTLVDCTSATETGSHPASRVGSYPGSTLDRRPSAERMQFAEAAPTLLDGEVLIELKNIKAAMVLSPNHPWPVAVEGLLIEHRPLPLCAHAEITLWVGDRDVLKEDFYLPTDRREEVMEADRKLAELNSEFLTNEHLRNRAMAVYYPELADEYDLWYRIEIDEHGLMTYALHIGPSNHQDTKKKIEGQLQL
jgi:hypothetical protein